MLSCSDQCRGHDGRLQTADLPWLKHVCGSEGRNTLTVPQKSEHLLAGVWHSGSLHRDRVCCRWC